MDYIFKYLEKQTLVASLISNNPEPGLKYIVTIPAYLESGILQSLSSLISCIPPKESVEVIIMINWPENESPENIFISKEIINKTNDWIKSHLSNWISFHTIILPDISKSKAGVGYARKIAMDEAVRRFLSAGQNDGIIISFDADSSCDPDYFTSIESHFFLNPRTDGCTIYFEHPYEGIEFSDEVYKGIVLYELHLRYYLHSIRQTGFPNAFYTLGSSFAVRTKAYCLQGGMNSRKAGEDFYFLQKMFDLGTFTELNSTRIIPSPRPSLRVPFGTGASIMDYINKKKDILSYNQRSFESLGLLFGKLPQLYKEKNMKMIQTINELDISIRSYLKSINFEMILEEINQNSSDFHHFRKRFFRYFNMFRILKYLNHAKKYYQDIPVTEGVILLLRKNGINNIPEADPKSLLGIFREMDRKPILQQ